MSFQIKKAAVLGAGVMGATIAAHLTNAGIECLLLDIMPPELTEADKAKGLTKESPAWRNRFAQRGLEGATKAKPASFYTKRNAAMIKAGNFEDNLGWLADVDLVIEVVIENLKIKQELFAKVEKVVKPNCIVATNTSGIRISEITANLGKSLKERFLGIHFFNPPRYMKLVEIIPGEETKKEVIEYMTRFCEEVLGKGVVICKDVPNFIANRIGVFDMSNAMNLMLAKGMKVEDIDAIISAALGRPRSAIFGTIDLVGLDTAYHVMTNLYEAVPKDESRDLFMPPDFVKAMIQKKWLGNKTKGGFYKKSKDAKGKKVKLALDVKTMDYVPANKPKFESVGAAKKSEAPVEKTVRMVFNGKDAAADLTREYLCNNFIYAANRIPEIADTIVEIDNAMKWGYNHQLGPFETWDAVGVKEAVEVDETAGQEGAQEGRGDAQDGLPLLLHEEGRRHLLLRLREEGLREACGEPEDHHPARPQGAQEDHPAKCGLQPHRHRRRRGLPRVPHQDERPRRGRHPDALFELRHRGEGLRGPRRRQPERQLLRGRQHLQGARRHPEGDWDILEKMINDFQQANMRLKYLRKARRDRTGRPHPGRRLRDRHARGEAASPRPRPTWASSKSASASSRPAAAPRSSWCA